MKKTSKKRLCWNCEGNVSVDAETCPYCGVSVIPACLDNAASGFTPSYRHEDVNDSSIPLSPYALPVQAEQENAQEDRSLDAVEAGRDAEDQKPHYDEFKRALFASALLLPGSVFFMFGLALLLFSYDGVFTLQWDGTIWFVYLILAIPLLLFGWRYLSKLDQDTI